MITAPNQEEQLARARTAALIMGLLSVVTFGTILVRLYQVQIRRGAEFVEKSKNNFVQLVRVEHDRGEILDREGRLLVTNRPSVNVEITPAFLPPTGRMLRRLGRAAEVSEKQLDSVIASFQRSAEERGPPILIARDVRAAALARVRELQESLELPLLAVPVLPMPAPHAELSAIYADPEHFPSEPRVVRLVAERLELSAEELELLKRRLARPTGLDRYLPITVRRDVPPELEERMAQLIRLGDVPGASVVRAQTRHYVHEDLAAHLLGYVNELSPQELEERREVGYRLGDSAGRRGVEKSFEENLRGVDGRRAVVVDAKGRPQASRFARSLEDEIGVREKPRPGDRVVLTLDLDLQRAAEQAFKSLAGAVVALEVHTGRVLAMTSTPSFNPNMVTGYFDPREKRRLDEAGPLRPWRFRAIQDHFAPGSTFKVATALAALERRVTTEHEHVSCPGSFSLGATRFRCWKESGHGSVDVVTALMRSCDVYFYAMGARLGLDAIAEQARNIGLGAPTGIPLDGESPGIVPTSAWYKKHLPEGYTLGAAVNASVGQGATTVTPVQLAVAYATLANGGKVFEPQVALEIQSYDGSARVEVPPKLLREASIPEAHLALVREGLKRVVNDPNGTAYRRRLPDLAVSGKTGTAQVAKLVKRGGKIEEIPWKLRDHAWFAAYAPADAPEIVVVVLVEHGGGGSAVAAPIAMQVIDAWHKKQARHAARLEPLELAVIGEEP